MGKREVPQALRQKERRAGDSSAVDTRAKLKAARATNALGRLVRMFPTGGQTNDYIGARMLVGDLLAAQMLLADSG